MRPVSAACSTRWRPTTRDTCACTTTTRWKCSNTKSPTAALDEVRIYFPDPWHKKRHNKRRLVQPALAALLVRKLAVDGRLHLATDWHDYAEQMWDVLDATPGLRNRAGPRGHVARPDWRPQTHFETRGQKLGHGVWDLLYDRC